MKLRATLMGSAIAVATLAAVSVLGMGSAHATVIDWNVWSPSFTIGNPGAASGTAGSVGITYTGEVDNLFLGYPSWQPIATFQGGDVGNAPLPADGIVQLTGGGSITDTIVFSHPVVNPVMAIWSLGGGSTPATFQFVSQPFSIQSGGANAEYGGVTIAQCPTNGVCGVEGNGTIEFLGTFSQISWTNPEAEYWYGFNVGVAATPLPSTWTMLIAGFIALGFFASRGAKKGSAAIAAA